MRVDTGGCILLMSFFLLVVFASCNNKSVTDVSGISKVYPNTIGDIIYDDQVDSNYILCEISINTVGFHYQGGFSTLKKTMFDDYKSIEKKGESGFVTIRFMVNCNGETTMYRIQGMNDQLEEREFDERITNELVRLIKESSGWKTIEINGSKVNYNQYLTFKILDGELIEIAP